jgi:hypothetical protein
MAFRRNIGMSIGLVALTLFVVSPYADERDAKDEGEEKTIRFETTNTTTFFSAPFNFTSQDPKVKFTGVANYAIFSGVGRLGRITGQGVSQSAFTTDPPTPCTLPDGSSGVALALEDHVAVTRFERTGDLLFERGKPGDLKACLNFETGIFHEEGRVEITGGTGRFSGARGFYTANQDGQVLVPPGSEQLQFGYATATYMYEITVPK